MSSNSSLFVFLAALLFFGSFPQTSAGPVVKVGAAVVGTALSNVPSPIQPFWRAFKMPFHVAMRGAAFGAAVPAVSGFAGASTGLLIATPSIIKSTFAGPVVATAVAAVPALISTKF